MQYWHKPPCVKQVCAFATKITKLMFLQWNKARSLQNRLMEMQRELTCKTIDRNTKQQTLELTRTQLQQVTKALQQQIKNVEVSCQCKSPMVSWTSTLYAQQSCMLVIQKPSQCACKLTKYSACNGHAPLTAHVCEVALSENPACTDREHM